MTIKELYQAGYKLHSKNRANNWVIAVVFVLFTCAFFALGYVIDGLYLIFIPFIILPLYFAFALFHFVQTNKADLSYRHIFKFFSLYYSPRFFGVFRIIISFLISLLVEIVVMMITGSILFNVFKTMYNPDFMDSITNVINNLSTTQTVEEMEELLNGTNGVLSLYSFWVSAITSFFTMSAFLYFIFKNSIDIYYRASVSPGNRAIQKKVLKALFSQRRGQIFKLYFLGVFGPLFLLLLLSYGGSLAICALNMGSIGLIQTTVYIASMGSLVFFLPFAMSNLEVIADHFQKDYITLFEGAVKSFLEQYAEYSSLLQNLPNQEENVEPSEDIIDNDNQKNNE